MECKRKWTNVGKRVNLRAGENVLESRIRERRRKTKGKATDKPGERKKTKRIVQI